MNTKRFQGLVFVSLLLLPYAVLAQSIQNDLRQTLKLKQSLSIDELTAEFMAIKISDDSQMGGAMPFMYMGMMFDMTEGEEQFEKVRYLDARWTKGDVVEIGGKGYLVTYKTDMNEVMMATSGEMVMTKQLALHLELVNLDNVRTLSPLADLTPAKYAELFGDMFADISRATRQVSGARGQTAALSHVKQLTLAMLMYATDYDDLTPYAQSTKTVAYVTEPYMKNDAIWETGNPEGSKFYFNMAIAGVSLSNVLDPAATVMFYESRGWPDGRRIVSFCDGHAKIITENEWQQYKLTLNVKIQRSAKPLPADYGIGGRIRPPD